MRSLLVCLFSIENDTFDSTTRPMAMGLSFPAAVKCPFFDCVDTAPWQKSRKLTNYGAVLTLPLACTWSS